MAHSVFETDPTGTIPAVLEVDETVHDLNNLLQSIRMIAELGLAQPLDGSPARGMFEEIRDACGEASKLANTLASPGHRAPAQQSRECFDISELVEDAMPLLSGSVDPAALLKFELTFDPAMITANPSHVRQILTNLVLNASQALEGRSGIVVVSTGTCDLEETSCETIASGHLVAGRYSFLEVSDNGCGMDEVTQARLFEPYFTTKPTGQGLGMASVRRIVTAQGGIIQIQSRRGAGTCIRVLFPGSESKEADFPVSGDRSPGNGHTFEWETAGTVLVVDDDRSIRMLTEVMLKSRGWRVLTANSGEEAVALLQMHRGQVSVVMLDMLMSGMDGFETLRRFRQIDSEVPVVILSGSSQQQLESRFGSELPCTCLSKPFSIDDLVDVITAAIADAPASHDRSDQYCRPIGSEPVTSNVTRTVSNESILVSG